MCLNQPFSWKCWFSLLSTLVREIYSVGCHHCDAWCFTESSSRAFRVYLALGRRNDLPKAFAKLDAQSNPRRAVLFTGVVVAVLCLMGDVRMTWSLSAVTVLFTTESQIWQHFGSANRINSFRNGYQLLAFFVWFLSIFVEQDSWFTAGILVVPAVLFSVVLRSRSNLSN